ncbi:MAG TPA: response regulator transcription factor [Chloroflexia bacterium]|nr:response regulator transcription factor [Chloroflexia bacterium]
MDYPGENNIVDNNPAARPKIRLMIVDDHEVVRKGLAMVIGLEDDIDVCCEAGSGSEAINSIQKLQPDVILMDYRMPGLSGVEAARAIKALVPKSKILILTGVNADATIFEALESGIDGYVLKEVTPDELIRAVRTVAAGGAYLHPAVTRKVIARMNRNGNLPGPSPADNFMPQNQADHEQDKAQGYAVSADHSVSERLSERELEVLKGVALGQNNREIAESLIVGEETVRTHLKSAFRKLGVNDRTQAVVVALKNGLISV